MESEIYPIIQEEEEYDAMAVRMNLLAEALVNVKPGQKLPKSKATNFAALEVIGFFKKLINKSSY